MTTKQVKFFDKVNQAFHGGILLDDDVLICGCCGSIFVKDDWDDFGIVILTEYDTWINLDEEIMGS